MKMNKHSRILYFAFSGFVGYCFDLAVTIIFTPSFGKYIARVPAFLVASTVTWLLNRNITFRNTKSNMSLFKEWLKYESIMLVGLAVNYTVYIIMVTFLPTGINYTAFAVAVAALVGMMVNYVNTKKRLFKNQRS